MHIPDGFIDAKTAIATGILAVAGIGAALWQAKRTLPSRQVPLLGVTAAFVFAAQMLNFPVVGGTSGHLLGAVLAAVLLGAVPAIVVMTTVLMVQCFLFQDGGVLALGANLFNMALLAPVTGALIYRVTRRALAGSAGVVLGGAFAAWCATVLAAISCAGQLALSGKVAWGLVLPAMGGIHMLIGLGEGVITALVLVAIARVRPELLERDAATETATTLVWTAGLVALGLAAFVAPFACGWPDGLEHVAEKLGFADHAVETPLVPAPFPDYALPGGWDAGWVTGIVGVIGTLVAFGLAWLLARSLTTRNG